MAWRIVKQPNGLLARFSDIVDDFTNMNMTEAEALKYCQDAMGTLEGKTKVQVGIDDIKPWTNIPGSGHDRWDDCLLTIWHVHGKRRMNTRSKWGNRKQDA